MKDLKSRLIGLPGTKIVTHLAGIDPKISRPGGKVLAVGDDDVEVKNDKQHHAVMVPFITIATIRLD